MANNIFLASGSTTAYISGTSDAAYTGSGTPWTAQTTTPYQIGMSDVDGRWTPQTAAGVLIFGGGPPFRAGRSPAFKSYDLVSETVTIQCRANSFDNAVTLKQQLFEWLNCHPNQATCLIGVQPNGSTNTAYTEIYSADIQESEHFINDEAGLSSKIIRCRITWTRSPFWTRSPSDGAITSINGVTIGNTGTGSPDNVEAFGASPSGELINEGQPTLVTLAPAQNTNYKIFYLASVQARTYSTTGAAALSTSSTTGTQTALNTVSISTAQARQGLKARSLMRFTNNTSNVQIRVEMRANTGGSLLYAGPWITPTSGSATLYDMGEVPLDAFKYTVSSTSLQLYIGYRSTNGSSATTTLGYNEFLLYWDFCRVDSPTSIALSGTATRLQVQSYQISQSNVRLALPLAAPIAVAADSSANPIDICTIRGTAPRLYDGGSLYAAWMEASNVHTTTNTATLSVRYAPLWLTFRGVDG